MSSFKLETGAKLRNGAIVLKCRDAFVVGSAPVALCKWGEKLVTWRVDQDGNAYLGRYHTDEHEAEKDFLER